MLRTPPTWSFDSSGADEGVFVALDEDGWAGGFRPNILVTQAAPEEVLSLDHLLETQRGLESELESQMTDYRLLYLWGDRLGTDDSQAVRRTASYTNHDGVPLTLNQWIARRIAAEVSFTLTFPTADLPVWSDAALMLAAGLEWKDRG